MKLVGRESHVGIGSEPGRVGPMPGCDANTRSAVGLRRRLRLQMKSTFFTVRIMSGWAGTPHL